MPRQGLRPCTHASPAWAVAGLGWRWYTSSSWDARFGTIDVVRLRRNRGIGASLGADLRRAQLARTVRATLEPLAGPSYFMKAISCVRAAQPCVAAVMSSRAVSWGSWAEHKDNTGCLTGVPPLPVGMATAGRIPGNRLLRLPSPIALRYSPLFPKPTRSAAVLPLSSVFHVPAGGGRPMWKSTAT